MVKTKKIKIEPKELDIELGQYSFKGKCREGNTVMTGEDILFKINGKPYTEVIGFCDSVDIHIGNSSEFVTIKLNVFPGKCRKSKKIR